MKNRKSEKHSFYINPLTDFGFKKLFCSDRMGAARLLALLKAYLPDKMEGVSSITFLPTELLGETEDTKRVSFDIYGLTNDGKHVIVEMQRGEQTFFANRIITYNCRVISQNIERGDLEYDIPMVISFSIMDYVPEWFTGSDDFFHIVQLKDEKNKIFSQKTFFCFLELRKFAALNPGQLKDMVFPDLRHKWAFVLKNMGRMDEQDLPQEDDIFSGLFEDGKYSKLTAMEKKEYKKSVLEYADVQDAIRCAQQKSLKAGIEQGREEGREEGRNEGREEGREEGIEEARRLLAKNMLAKGLAPSLIAEISGLTEEEVSTLAKE
ncbi:MAG: Rpn family recombination-promoting nuclease/putative transposase [Bacteroidales bacterium]|nr:Rpn family recombination-promoting nuclease/putative transposase [Bacteroidales bacterium]